MPFPLSAANTAYFYRARNAIYHLVRALGFGSGDRVLVPAYHSGNEVAAIRAAGATPVFYRITRALDPDFGDLERLCVPGTRALLAIHYLGWPQPVRRLVEFCRERGLILIEDCALALLSEADGAPLGSFGDYAIFCLYKTLPVPNGGMLVQNRGLLRGVEALSLRRCGVAPLLGRSAELLLEWLRSRSDAPGRTLMALKRASGRALRAAGATHVPIGEIGFDAGLVDIAMSATSAALMRRWDYGLIRRRRRENFSHLRERLAGRMRLLKEDLPEGACPLSFPVLVADKRSAARRLAQRGVGAIEFWNDGDAEASREDFRDTRFLREHVLELPLHQELSPDQLDYVAATVRRLELRPAC